jgi:hypothetical protein
VQLPELTLDDKVAILEMLLPFAMAGRMPHTAEINQLVPPDDPGNPSTISRRLFIDRLLRRAHELRA